jgi:hypothetical protein
MMLSTLLFVRLAVRRWGPTQALLVRRLRRNWRTGNWEHAIWPPPSRGASFFAFLSTVRLSRLNEMCVICWEGPAFFPIQPPTSKCKHIANVCQPCLRQTIRTVVISNGAGADIKCPNAACNNVLSYYDVRRWVDHHTFKKWAIFDRVLWRC